LRKQRHFVSLSFCSDRLIQRFDLLVEHGHQLEQVVSTLTSQKWAPALHLYRLLAAQYRQPATAVHFDPVMGGIQLINWEQGRSKQRQTQ